MIAGEIDCGICNYYGGLSVFTEAGKFYWSIDCCMGCDTREIPESLYNEIKKHIEKEQLT